MVSHFQGGRNSRTFIEIQLHSACSVCCSRPPQANVSATFKPKEGECHNIRFQWSIPVIHSVTAYLKTYMGIFFFLVKEMRKTWVFNFIYIFVVALSSPWRVLHLPSPHPAKSHPSLIHVHTHSPSRGESECLMVWWTVLVCLTDSFLAVSECRIYGVQ